MTGQLILFGVLAAIAVVCGIAMIMQDNPVRSALYLVLVLFSVALLFLSLHAVFIAAVQMIVYAGAIMVLFIFVIMLLNLGTPERVMDRLKPQQPLSVVAGIGRDCGAGDDHCRRARAKPQTLPARSGRAAGDRHDAVHRRLAVPV